MSKQIVYLHFFIYLYIVSNIVMRFIGVSNPCNISPLNLVITHYTTTYVVRNSIRISSSYNPMSSGQFCIAPPETKVRNKWMEFQGLNNWDGLLDPLDHGLKNEILRYGGFVEAAYRSFNFDRSSPEYGTCRFGPNLVLGLQQSGYKVTRNLHVTCGVRMPRWIDKAHCWVTTQSSWIGYVAVCDDKDVIAKLGRRDVVIALRGTATCLEWIENLRTKLTPLPLQNHHNNGSSLKVETGFFSLYTSCTDTCRSLCDTLKEEIERVIKSYGDEPLSITITGHSLGAALGTLAAHHINSAFSKCLPLVTVISFGGPRIGNKCFSKNLEKNGIRILRIVNSNDVVTKVPGFMINHTTKRNHLTLEDGWVVDWFRKRVQDTQWLYADVGKELRLCCNSSSPYLNIATCHDLKTYLELVEGLASSTCPLRAKAKKLLYGAQHDKKVVYR